MHRLVDALSEPIWSVIRFQYTRLNIRNAILLAADGDCKTLVVNMRRRLAVWNVQAGFLHIGALMLD